MAVHNVVGIDIAKRKIDVCFLSENQRETVVEKDYDDFTGRLVDYGPDLVVLEASGGYEQDIATRVVDAGLPLVMANPSRVRSHAKAIGFLAKTDAIDAYVIARFGQDVKPEPRPQSREKTGEM